MSGQFKFGGGGGIQKSGYDESQLSSPDGAVLILGGVVEIEGLLDVDLLDIDALVATIGLICADFIIFSFWRSYVYSKYPVHP
jgi:hypothetical protein